MAAPPLANPDAPAGRVDPHHNIAEPHREQLNRASHNYEHDSAANHAEHQIPTMPAFEGLLQPLRLATDVGHRIRDARLLHRLAGRKQQLQLVH